MNRLVVASDGAFFASCSDDQTVKIWESYQSGKPLRLPRLSYTKLGGRLKAMALLEHSHCLAVASDTGEIHVMSVEHEAKWRLTRLPLQTPGVRPSADGCVVDMHHFNMLAHSVLVYATTGGLIGGWDLRSGQRTWQLQNDASYGPVTSLVVDGSRYWLLVGTGRGVYTPWDIRFQLPLTTWTDPGRYRVHRLAAHPQHDKASSWVLAAAGPNEVTAWDVACGERTQVFQCANDGNASVARLEQPSWRLRQNAVDADMGIAELQHLAAPLPANVVRALLCSPDNEYFLTAGSDRTIRLWDLHTAAQSFVVTGPHAMLLGAGARAPPSTRFLTRQLRNDVTLFHEVHERNPPDLSSPVYRGTSICHADCITDLAFLERPHRLLLSASRDGRVKLWR